jgi:hypothetical protein
MSHLCRIWNNNTALREIYIYFHKHCEVDRVLKISEACRSGFHA